MGLWVILSECRLLTFEEESRTEEEEVFGCSRGIARVGNLSVSKHMRVFASCSPDTMHLSTSVSPALGVWHFPLLPDFKPKQLCCFAHGTNLVTNKKHSHTWAISHHSRVILHKHMHEQLFLSHIFKTVVWSHHCNKANTCSNHYTPKYRGKKTYNQDQPLRIVVSWIQKKRRSSERIMKEEEKRWQLFQTFKEEKLKVHYNTFCKLKYDILWVCYESQLFCIK